MSDKTEILKEVLYPDMFADVTTEFAVMGYCIEKNDTDIFYSLRKDYFTNNEIIELYSYLCENGLLSRNYLERTLQDNRNFGHLAAVVEQACSHTSMVYDWKGMEQICIIDELMDLLRSISSQRKLSQLSIDIQKNLDKGDNSFKIVSHIDTAIGDLYNGSKHAKNNSLDKMLKSLSESPLVGVQTGIRSFDEQTFGLVRGGIVSIAGISGNLKTTNAISLLRSILKVNPKMTGMIFELDMDEELFRNWWVGQCGVNRNHILGNKINKQEIADILAEDEILTRVRYYTYEKDRIGTVEQIKREIIKYSPDIWMIDYMGQLIMNESIEKKRGYANHNNYFSEAMTELKNLAARKKSIGMIIHQANFKDLKFRKDPRPILGDIEYSSDITRLSNYVYLCYYPCKYVSFNSTDANRIFIQIWDKTRTAAETFTVLEFDPSTGLMGDPSDKILNWGTAHWNRLENENHPNTFINNMGL